jgi:hypothetical protein
MKYKGKINPRYTAKVHYITMLGRFMRTTFLAIFFALMTCCATADEIDNVITNLQDEWNDNETGVIIMPKTASTGDVLQKALGKWWFPTSQPPTNYIQFTNFTALKTREVSIPAGHYPSAQVHTYTAVLLQASQGVQLVVLLRYFDVYSSRAWVSAVFEVMPRPNNSPEPTAVGVLRSAVAGVIMVRRRLSFWR